MNTCVHIHSCIYKHTHTQFSPVLFHILHKTLILPTVGFILGARSPWPRRGCSESVASCSVAGSLQLCGARAPRQAELGSFCALGWGSLEFFQTAFFFNRLPGTSHPPPVKSAIRGARAPACLKTLGHEGGFLQSRVLLSPYPPLPLETAQVQCLQRKHPENSMQSWFYSHHSIYM